MPDALLRNSKDIVRRLQAEGWTLLRITGSHHHFGKEGVRFIVTVPHPKRDLPVGTVRAIYRQAGWL
jgi:predicted RNA binding protein YcfA (HicA-like mRNA interferase family)